MSLSLFKGARLRRFSALRADQNGLALVEFAYVAPILLVLAMAGAELTNYALTQMRISQLAISLADNASRARQFVSGAAPRFREHDARQVFQGAQLQSGGLDIRTNGRIVLSSLERNVTGGQWIHWQRCFGAKTKYAPQYGRQGTGAVGTSYPGMGPSSNRVTAEQNFAVMYVEIAYEYKPLVFTSIVPRQTIRKNAAMFVRDDRDLTGDLLRDPRYGNVFNPAPAVPASSIDLCA